MNNRIWAIGTGLVIVAVLGLGWLLGISPLLTAKAAADEQRVGVEATNLAQEALLAQMKADYDRVEELEAQIAALRLSIPTEVDSDFLFDYLSTVQLSSGAFVKSIVAGQAQPYGVPTDGTGAVAPTAPAAETPTTESPSTDASAAPVDPAAVPTIPSVEGLYTVPLTITFDSSATVAQIMEFSTQLQNGPRVFLVTQIAREASGDSSGTITAYMFVISHPDETPGSTAGEYGDWKTRVSTAVAPPWPSSSGPTPTPSPTPTEDADEDSEPVETPGPTPSGTPTP